MPRVRTTPLRVLAVVATLTLMSGWGWTHAGDGEVDGDRQPITIQLIASTHVQGAYKPCT